MNMHIFPDDINWQIVTVLHFKSYIDFSFCYGKKCANGWHKDDVTLNEIEKDENYLFVEMVDIQINLLTFVN